MTPQTPNVTPAAIRDFRDDKRLTQQELATILNVGVATVSRWETGEAKPTGTAAAVLQALIVASLGEHATRLLPPSAEALYRLLKTVFEGSEA